jgi:hypothetical protein
LTDGTYDPNSSFQAASVPSLLDASKLTDDAASVSSSKSHRSSTGSVLSDRLKLASKRGEERANRTRSSKSVSSEKRKKKGKVDLSAVVRNKAQSLEVDGKRDVVDLSLLEREEKAKKKSKSDDKSKGSSKRSRSKKWESASLGSQLNPNKYTDLGYLTKSASTKFQKGVYLLRKSKYQMARELEIYILLYMLL